MKLPESRLKEMEAAFEDIERRLSEPALASQPQELKRLGKQHAELKAPVEAWRDYRRAEEDLAEAKTMLAEAKGAERAYVQGEIEELETTLEELAERISVAVAPRDPNDERDVIMEIRAGAGGEEAGLFAGELLRMYQRYAENRRWKIETLNSDPSDLGGFRDVTIAVKGKDAYSRLKYEAGVHRVQRVPVTESSGRIHTSAVAVNVLPEAEEVEVDIDPNDLRIDVYRSSGPGGQSVNTTDSAVRIKHLPTGIEVACQDEKSQIQNRAKAMRILRARLFQAKQEEQQKALAEERRSQVRTADRSERIRTYNFPENRISDHRVGYKAYNLDQVLDGDLDPVIDALTRAHTAELLAAGS